MILNSPIINLKKETNLPGNKTESYTIQFDVAPILESNSGTGASLNFYSIILIQTGYNPPSKKIIAHAYEQLIGTRLQWQYK